MLGIVLIALAAIIGLGFGVFAIAKGTANDGVTGVQENLGVVGNSAFTDYDQKIVTGTQVISAIQNFEGKPYSILVSTNAVKKATSAADIANLAGVKESYGTRAVLPILTERTEGLGAGVTASNYINYNALLGGFESAKSGGTQTVADSLAFVENRYVTDGGLSSEGGKILMNNVTGNLSKSGMAEYIPSGGRFQAYLIKDPSGTILGITFNQINNK